MVLCPRNQVWIWNSYLAKGSQIQDFLPLLSPHLFLTCHPCLYLMNLMGIPIHQTVYSSSIQQSRLIQLVGVLVLHVNHPRTKTEIQLQCLWCPTPSLKFQRFQSVDIWSLTRHGVSKQNHEHFVSQVNLSSRKVVVLPRSKKNNGISNRVGLFLPRSVHSPPKNPDIRPPLRGAFPDFTTI